MDDRAGSDHEAMLVVCRANLIRSPLASALLRRRLLDLGREDLLVSSRGLQVVPGATPGPEVRQVASEHGLGLEGHRPEPVTPESLLESSLVVTMTESQRTAVYRLSPGVLARTFTLVELVRLLAAGNDSPATTWSQLARRAHVVRPLVPPASEAEDVPDPIGRPLDHHRAVAATLVDLVDQLGRHVASDSAPR